VQLYIYHEIVSSCGGPCLQRRDWIRTRRTRILRNSQLSRRSADQSAQLSEARKQVGRVQQQLARARRVRDDHIDFLSAVAACNVPRINVLIRVGLARGLSVKKLGEQLARAVAGVYHVKSYSDAERDLAMLVVSIGGQRLPRSRRSRRTLLTFLRFLQLLVPRPPQVRRQPVATFCVW